jgi:glycosyltransferase involved in cell wall biosynthesis
MKYEIIIPAYNAENTIRTLISQIRHLENPPVKIIVIDDGSKDGTAKIASQMGVEIIKQGINRGKGAALKIGFRHFMKHSPCDYLLCMDADLQHPVSSIPDFLNFIKKYDCKVLIGNRKKSLKLMPLHRILSNMLTSFIITILTKQKIKDSQCGYRLIHKDILRKIKLYENDFQLESEMILRVSENNVKIYFIDIPTIYNTHGSYINNIQVTLKFILLIGREIKKRMLKK